MALFGKTLPAVSEEGLTIVFKKGLVACACEWPVDYVQLSPSGLCSRENRVALFEKTLPAVSEEGLMTVFKKSLVACV